MTDESTTEVQEPTEEEKTQQLYMQLNGHMAMCNGMNMADILRLTCAMNIDVVLQTAQRQGIDTAAKVVDIYKQYHVLTLEKMETVMAEVAQRQDDNEDEGEKELDLSDRAVFDPPSGVQ